MSTDEHALHHQIAARTEENLRLRTALQACLKDYYLRDCGMSAVGLPEFGAMAKLCADALEVKK